MNYLEQAIAIAAYAHQGDVDKGGAAYVWHPLRVSLAVQGEYEKIAAVLHDVVEDSDVTFDDLEEVGFPIEVIDAVDALTKRPGESRLEAAARAAADPIALVVKIADVTDNMDLSRISDPGPRDYARLAEYREVIAYLNSVKES